MTMHADVGTVGQHRQVISSEVKATSRQLQVASASTDRTGPVPATLPGGYASGSIRCSLRSFGK